MKNWFSCAARRGKAGSIIKTTTKRSGRTPGVYERTAAYSPAPQRRRKPKQKKKTWVMIPVLLICVLALAIVMGTAYTMKMKKLADTDTIFPNVMVAGVNVGGMTKEEAAQAIHNAVDGEYESNTLLVKLPDRTLELTPTLTRVSIDVDAVVDLAWDYGREGSFWDVAKAFQEAENTSYVIEINDAITLDTTSVRAIIDQTAAAVNTEMVRTQVAVNKTAGTITITQGSPSRMLDAETLYAAVLQAYANNDFTTLTMDYVEQYPDKVDLLALYDEYTSDAVDATYDPTTGNITQEKVGYGFDFEKENAIISMLQPGESYTIQMEVRNPQVTAEMLVGDLFQDVLAEYSSPYVWNPERTTNLTLACEEIDGQILNPGEVFSFNETVGERTAARGFQPAAVYVGIETADELGGGVCQVASTIYYCALMANQEIVERTEHRYLVTYVPKGMDATIYWDSKLDFQFRNTTGYPMKILANTENNCVNITLLGTNETGEYAEMTFEILGKEEFEDEIEVDLEQPPDYEEQTQSPYTGYEVQTYRNVYNANGELISTKKEAYSIYAMRNRIITVGYGNPRIPEDYEYPPGTVFPELPPQQPDPDDGSTDVRPGDDELINPDAPDEEIPDEPVVPDDPVQPSEPTEPSVPTEPTVPGEEGDFIISGDG